MTARPPTCYAAIGSRGGESLKSQGSHDLYYSVVCTRAREVWKELGLKEVIDQALCANRSGFVDLVILFSSPSSKSPVLCQLGLQETIAIGCWYIWWQRREIVKGIQVASPKSSAFAINALKANFGVPIHRSSRSETAWTKPISGTQKLNVDASFYNDGSGGVGAVLRNSKG